MTKTKLNPDTIEEMNLKPEFYEAVIKHIWGWKQTGGGVWHHKQFAITNRDLPHEIHSGNGMLRTIQSLEERLPKGEPQIEFEEPQEATYWIVNIWVRHARYKATDKYLPIATHLVTLDTLGIKPPAGSWYKVVAK